MTQLVQNHLAMLLSKCKGSCMRAGVEEEGEEVIRLTGSKREQEVGEVRLSNKILLPVGDSRGSSRGQARTLPSCEVEESPKCIPSTTWYPAGST